MNFKLKNCPKAANRLSVLDVFEGFDSQIKSFHVLVLKFSSSRWPVDSTDVMTVYFGILGSFDNSWSMNHRPLADIIGTLMWFIEVIRPLSWLTDIFTDKNVV